MIEIMICDKPFQVESAKFVEQPYRVNGEVVLDETINDDVSAVTACRLMKTAAEVTSWEARPEDVDNLAKAMVKEWNLPLDGDSLKPYVALYSLSLLKYQQ